LKHAQTTAEIDLARLRHNLSVIQDLVGDCRILAVVKANGYGHGVTTMLPALDDFPDLFLGVATVDEAIEIRRAGGRHDVLIMGLTDAEGIDEALLNNCSLTIFRPEMLPLIESHAATLGTVANLHVKVDTGMTRLGVRMAELDSFLASLDHMPHLTVEGIFSHLVDSSNADNDLNFVQEKALTQAVAKVRGAFPDLRYVHLANSGGTLNFPGFRYDMVRVGILPLGIYPPGYKGGDIDVTPILTLASEVIDAHRVPAGTGVGYSHSYETKGETAIIVLPIGYADGYPRKLGNRAHVLFRGKRRPVVGNVSMDYITVDVGDESDIQIGERATIIGRDGAEEVTATELAELSDTIVYEIICGLGRRIARVPV